MSFIGKMLCSGRCRSLFVWACMSCLLVACTRSSVPAVTQTPLPPAATATEEIILPTEAPTQAVVVPGEGDRTYAVVWVEADASLIIHQPAGISSVAVGSLAPDQRGIQLTGKTTLLGSSQWLEIYKPGGGTGWVNGWNLTEAFDPQDFCRDARVMDLIANLAQAISDRDGNALAELVSPRRGLIIRHNWWNPELQFKVAEVAELFINPDVYHWGIDRDSELAIEGTFKDVILPKWQDVFEVGPEVGCNQLNIGSTAQPALWPVSYSNLNFYSFFRKAAEPGNQLNWRTWGIGIEYVGGEPYVAVLVQFRGEI